MGKTLIVAEKPSVGRDLAAVLPGKFEKIHDGKALEADEYVITWAVGHLAGLADPDTYDPKWKKWRAADLPIIPEHFALQARSGDSKKQLALIHKLVKRDDVVDVINACDAGREGELIFAYTMDLAPVSKPVRRLWISSMTRAAIKEGFDRLRAGEEMHNLELSARSRSEADWLVGMNATRAATLRVRSMFGGVVSLGRVQTPTLGILAERERQIAAFEPETYHLVLGTFEAGAKDRTYSGTWFDPAKPASDKRSTWVLKPEEAQQIVDAVRGQSGVVEKLEKKAQSERPPLLYDLTSLQRDANRRFGYAAKTTLGAAQSLYERHKLLTYPRTSSRYLTTDMVDEIKPRARMLGKHALYADASRYVTGLGTLPLERIVNNDKVDDHHAIIPTEQSIEDLSKLRDTEKRIYDLVVRRFLAAFHPTARYELTNIVTNVAEQRFRTKGRVMVEAGWRAVYGVGADVSEKDKASDDENEQQQLPAVEQGERSDCTQAEYEVKQTKPPARYSEGTLLSAMETAGKLVDDEKLREAMKDSGLGTPATRAAIIELLIDRQYVQREGRSLRVTPKGLKLIELLAGHPLTSPEMTGTWEKQLRDIEHGELDAPAFLQGIEDFTRKTVEKILEIDKEKLKLERIVLGPCPRCAAAGREEVIRENSRAYGCTSWKSREEPGCGFVIWRTVAGRQLMPDEAKELMENRITTQELQGFRSRNGKPFRARLKLNDEDKVEFVFAERKGKGKAAKRDASESNDSASGDTSSDATRDEEPVSAK